MARSIDCYDASLSEAIRLVGLELAERGLADLIPTIKTSGPYETKLYGPLYLATVPLPLGVTRQD